MPHRRGHTFVSRSLLAALHADAIAVATDRLWRVIGSLPEHGYTNEAQAEADVMRNLTGN